MSIKNGMRPVHPGEILREEFMLPMKLSANALAKQLKVTTTRISEIAREKRGISGDTALRLSKFFDMSPEFWLNLQSSYELRLAELNSDISNISQFVWNDKNPHPNTTKPNPIK